MLKNERSNRRKAFILTALVHLGILGGVLLYSYSDTVATYLPESVKEWLPNTTKEAPAPKKAKAPQA